MVTMFAAVGVVASIKRHHVKRSYSPALYSDDDFVFIEYTASV